MDDHDERWAAVAAAISTRMAELAYSQADLERRSGISDTTIRKITTGEPGNYRKKTLGQLSMALNWPNNAIERLLAGEDPATFPQTVRLQPPTVTSRVPAWNVSARRRTSDSWDAAARSRPTAATRSCEARRLEVVRQAVALVAALGGM